MGPINFTSLLPRPPQQNFADEYFAGQDAAQRNRVMGMQTALTQQQMAQDAQLFPSKLQQQQAQAQEAQMRAAAAQQQQRDANIFATSFGDAAKAAASSSSTPPAGIPRTMTPGASQDAPTKDPDESEDDSSTPPPKPAGASSAPASSGPVAATALLPGGSGSGPTAAPGMSEWGDDMFSRAAAMAAQRGASPGFLVNLKKEIADMQTALGRAYGEKQKVMATNYTMLADRLDAYANNDDEVYKEQNYGRFVSQLESDGAISHEESAQTLDKWGGYPGDQAFHNLANLHRGSAQLMENNLKQAQINREKAQQENEEAQTRNLQAELPGKQAASDVAQIRSWAQQLGTARDQASYDNVRNEMPKKYADQLPDVFDRNTPALIDRWGQTSEQRATAAATAARNAQTANYQNARLGIEQQRLTRENGSQTRINGLTPNEWQTKANALAAEGRGYFATINQLQTQLSQPYTLDKFNNPVLDQKGNPVPKSGAQKQALQSQLNTARASMQDLQYRVADHTGHSRPPDGAAESTPVGGQVVASDGSAWIKKSDGILYNTGKPPVAPQAQPGSPSAQPRPSSHQVGDVVTVRGQRLKITRMYSDGTFDGDPIR